MVIELFDERGKSKLGVAKSRVLQASKKSIPQKHGALKAARDALQVARLERAIYKALNPEPPYTVIPRDERRRLAKELSK